MRVNDDILESETSIDWERDHLLNRLGGKIFDISVKT